MRNMTDAQCQAALTAATRDGAGDAQLAGLAIGCPVHGNAAMDWDDDGQGGVEVFCSLIH